MTLQRFPTTYDYAERAESCERQLQSLERRRDAILAQIAQYKSPRSLLVSLLTPLYRRSLTFEVRHLRRECEQLELQILDVKAEKDAWQAEWDRRASELEENTLLYEQEQVVQREYRWLALQDDQHELRQRKAVLSKVCEQQRLREEAHALHVQQRTLQHRLKEVREQMSTNHQQLAASDDTAHTTLAYSADDQTAIADKTTLPVYVTSK